MDYRFSLFGINQQYSTPTYFYYSLLPIQQLTVQVPFNFPQNPFYFNYPAQTEVQQLPKQKLQGTKKSQCILTKEDAAQNQKQNKPMQTIKDAMKQTHSNSQTLQIGQPISDSCNLIKKIKKKRGRKPKIVYQKKPEFVKQQQLKINVFDRLSLQIFTLQEFIGSTGVKLGITNRSVKTDIQLAKQFSENR